MVHKSKKASRANSSVKKLLLVEDDTFFREALASGLESAGYEITHASNGRSAQHILGAESIDAVITDIQMPGGTGLELLHYIRRNHPLPVIVMTGFKEMADSNEAYSLGAKHFLFKPFKKHELLRALEECFSAGKEKNATETSASSHENTSPKNWELTSDSEYCQLNIDDFISGSEIQYDIYIRLASDRFVKIANKGDVIPMERITSYKNKNVAHLFMKSEDFQRYLGFNLAIMEGVRRSKSIDKTRKLNFLKHTGEIALEHMYLRGIDQHAFDAAQSLVSSSISLLSNSHEMFDLLETLNQHGSLLYARSLGASLLSVMIARELKWTSTNTLFRVSAGALLADIGKKEFDPQLLEKPRKDLTPAEIDLLKTHPTRGFKTLSELHIIPSEVLMIVIQHHESCNGTGYPAAIQGSRIYPLAKIVGLAEEFVTYTIPCKDLPRTPAPDAIRRISRTNAGRFDPAHLSALGRVFGIKDL